MRKGSFVLLIISYSLFNINTYAIMDIGKNVIIQNDGQVQYDLGCIDPTACNYDSNATEDSGNCTYDCISPEVVCPEDDEIYLCVPNTTPPALELTDFIPSGNTTLLQNLIFNPEQADGVNPDFTLTIYSYVIEDLRGNQRTCIQRFYNTNKPIDGPEVETTIELCQDEFWSFIRKPFLDNYRFYADNRGAPGELLRICQFPYSVCSTANFGLDTRKVGSSQFWVTSFIRFTEDEICESEPQLITVNVRPKPEISLVEKNIVLRLGEYVNLRDMINGDKSGVWKGEGIVSFSVPDGDTWYFFGSSFEGTRKLYYTIGNEFCSETLILVVQVVASRNNKRSGISNLKVYPNPSKGTLFVDASSYLNKKLSITITDIYGRVNFTYETNKVQQQHILMDLGHLAKGMYFIEMRSPLFHSVDRIVLE